MLSMMMRRTGLEAAARASWTSELGDPPDCTADTAWSTACVRWRQKRAAR